MDRPRTAAAEQEPWAGAESTNSYSVVGEQLVGDSTQGLIDRTDGAERTMHGGAALETSLGNVTLASLAVSSPSRRRSFLDGHARTSHRARTEYAGDDLVDLYLKDISIPSLLTAEQEVDLAKRIEAGLYAKNLLHQMRAESEVESPQPDQAATADVAAIERLKHQKDGATHTGSVLAQELEYIVQQGVDAKQTMLESNLRLVVAIARRYRPPIGMTFLDLVSEGNVGLVRAVEKFDYAKGFKFSTYSTWWIRQSISRAISEKGRLLRIPVHAVEVLNRLERLRREDAASGIIRTDEEIAAELDITPVRLAELESRGRSLVSLDQPAPGTSPSTVFDMGSELGGLIEDADERSMDDIVALGLVGQAIEETFKEADLTDQEVRVLRYRFGLETGEDLTLTMTGRMFGLSRPRIAQIERSALSKLRTVVTTGGIGLKDYLELYD